jgi:hypothetical protein
VEKCPVRRVVGHVVAVADAHAARPVPRFVSHLDGISRSVRSCTELSYLGNFSAGEKTGLDQSFVGKYLSPLLSQNFPVNGCRNPSATTGQISSSLNRAHRSLALRRVVVGLNALRMEARRLACGVGSCPAAFGGFVHLEEGEAR